MENDMGETIESLKKELKEWLLEDGENINYISDKIMELADDGVPVYNSDRIDWLSEDYMLAYVDDPGLVKENPSVFDILAVSIYEKIEQELYEYVQELEEDMVECIWCGNKFLFCDEHQEKMKDSLDFPESINEYEIEDAVQYYCSWKCWKENEENLNSHLGDKDG